MARTMAREMGCACIAISKRLSTPPCRRPGSAWPCVAATAAAAPPSLPGPPLRFRIIPRINRKAGPTALLPTPPTAKQGAGYLSSPKVKQADGSITPWSAMPPALAWDKNCKGGPAQKKGRLVYVASLPDMSHRVPLALSPLAPSTHSSSCRVRAD
ncbi:hypothetical protein BCV69DRAFT_178899 [Microstroma glucosiphilum]|uniref:Uncharacterized protein n=1 Tax=Pseudomicrostroma glucosiphilum TaxID=1684307 RepID=A0A316U6Q2_9BASI|nr:hypothetical protein BCV69DRAFT_178899 [Pseudomicrostroma glucosiphilum]PWN20926.1 hypothetical protein BCV69DRAFT_178899 [Pseudomicrostroma glucosiphilum]